MNTTEITFLRACPTTGRRLTEWLRLESISGEHLIQGFCSSVARYSTLPRIMSGWVLRTCTDISVCIHWTPVRRVSLFLYSSSKLFLHTYNVPLNPLFSRMNSPISTLLCQVLEPFNISVLVCWIRPTLLDSFQTSLVLVGSELDSALQMHLTSAEQRWRITSFNVQATLL